jgi:nucleotidyltransferase-like protein
VKAVTLGGSRAWGTHRPDSDWDFAVYYRGHFDPQSLRDIGWPGEVSEVGGWSKGVFNGGAWLEIDGRRADVHYRDLDTIDREIAASREGQFNIEPLMFHLAGLPSYLVLAELAVKQVLRGELPTPSYPVTLRERASGIWWDRAERTFDYARANHAPYGRLAQCAGLVAQATSYAAHAVLAARGQWVTNEKTLLTRAGLRQVDEFIAAARPDPGVMRDVVDRSRAVCSETVREAVATLALESIELTSGPGSPLPARLPRVSTVARGRGCAPRWLYFAAVQRRDSQARHGRRRAGNAGDMQPAGRRSNSDFYGLRLKPELLTVLRHAWIDLLAYDGALCSEIASPLAEAAMRIEGDPASALSFATLSAVTTESLRR